MDKIIITKINNIMEQLFELKKLVHPLESLESNKHNQDFSDDE